MKTLTFESSLDGQINHNILETSVALPPVFTLCSAFKETLLKEVSFFTIYGESGEPWMSLSNYQYKYQRMFLKINKVWVKITELPLHWMLSWIAVCIHADTVTGNISVLLNSEPPLLFHVEELTRLKPGNLKQKLFVGLSDTSATKQQFYGEVANLNIFSNSKDLKNIQANPCELVGDLVNADSTWKQVGEVKEKKEDCRNIFGQKQTYRVAIPAEMYFDDANAICPKLGGGNMTEASDENDVKDTIALFNLMNSTCENIWTPFIDKEVEGEFRSVVNGELATYLPWSNRQPDGGDQENYVMIWAVSRLYFDVHNRHLSCLSCDLKKTREFFLIGVCKQSYFSEFYFFTCI